MAEALVLADATRCPVNLLHLSSAEAVSTGARGRREFPHLDIRLETTLHHLALTWETAGGAIGKVNPPIRTEADREALWQAVLDGSIAIVDLRREMTVTPGALNSAQDFTPFQGMEVRGWPTETVLRGQVVFRRGAVEGRPAGQYVKRPVGLHAGA
jgi:dihydroorotase-like cyclic amidohydrolase